MREFSYKNKIVLSVSTNQLEELINMVDPYSCGWLYNDIVDVINTERKEESQVRQDRKEKHPPEIIKYWQDLDLKTDVLIKKQISTLKLYSTLYNKYEYVADKKNKDKAMDISINTMLAYELYDIVSNKELEIARVLDKARKGELDSTRGLEDGSEAKERILRDYQTQINESKNLIHSIFKNFSHTEMHKVRIDYDTLTIVEHFDYCNIP